MPSTPSSLVRKPPAATDALVVLDMIGTWRFPDGARMLRAALSVTPAIAALADRCRRAKVPVIFANDNRGDWRSDFREQLGQCMEAGGDAAAIAQRLAPGPGDYIVLKARHSAFYATPLRLLLQDLGCTRIIVCGVGSDQCVLATAMDAQIRRIDVVVPRDGSATKDAARHARLMRLLSEAMDIATPRCGDVRFRKS